MPRLTTRRAPGVRIGAAPDWNLARHLAEQRWAHMAGEDYLPVRTNGTAVSVGPLVRDGQPGCVACADARHRAVLHGAGTSVEVADDVRALPLPAHWRAALDAAVDEVCAGVAGVVVIDVATGETHRHRVVPVPECPACDARPDDSAAGAALRLACRVQAGPAERLRTRPRPAPGQLHETLVDFRYGPVAHVYRDQSAPLALVAAESAVVSTPGRMGGYGRAVEFADAEAIALLEALERAAGATPTGRRTTVTGSFAEVAADALDPTVLGLPEPECADHPDYELDRYAPDVRTRWVWGWDLTAGRAVLVPEHVAYFQVPRAPDAARFLFECSNGCSLGASLEEAILYGCLETIERDAFLLSWYSGTTPTPLALRPGADPELEFLRERTRADGYEVHLLDITSGIGVPVVWALAVSGDTGATFTAAGAHPDPRRAAASALHEVCVNVALDRRLPRPPYPRLRAMVDDPDLVRTLDDHGGLHTLAEVRPRFDYALRGEEPRDVDEHFAGWRERWIRADLTETLRLVVAAMAADGAPPVVVEQTGALERTLGLAAVKVIAPGSLPMTFGHLNRRVRGLPRLDRARAAAGIDRPILPHPFP